MIELRDYQEEAENTVAEELKERNALCVMPCGLGKTEVMIEHCNRHNKGRWLVILNKVDLFEQTLRRFKKGIQNQSLSAVCATSDNEIDFSGDIVIGTIQSLYKTEILFDRIIMDEVHNAANMEGEGRYKQLLSRQPQAKLLGFTATPFRMTGPIYGPGQLFSDITYKKSLSESIKEGWLVRPKLKGSKESFDLDGVGVTAGEWNSGDIADIVSDERKVRAQVVDAIARSKDRKKIVWFCANIAHAELVRNILEELLEKASIIHSKLSKEDRRQNKECFEATDCRHLTFVTIVSEGYDFPPVDCVVMMRPTRSAILYVQTVGRAMRPFPGKEDCLILDYGRVIENLGPIDNPILLEPRRKAAQKQIDELKQKAKFCPDCMSYLLAPYPEACPDCGFIFPKLKPLPELEQKPETELDILQSTDWRPSLVDDVSVMSFTSKEKRIPFLKIKYLLKGRVVGEELLNLDQKNFGYPKTRQRAEDLRIDFKNPIANKFNIFTKSQNIYFKAKRMPSSVNYRLNHKGWPEVRYLDFEDTLSLESDYVGEGD